MSVKFLSVLAGGLFLSTAVLAMDSQGDSLSPRSSRSDSVKDPLELLKDVHNYNEIFDNYHSGGIPYEAPPQNKE